MTTPTLRKNLTIFWLGLLGLGIAVVAFRFDFPLKSLCVLVGAAMTAYFWIWYAVRVSREQKQKK